MTERQFAIGVSSRASEYQSFPAGPSIEHYEFHDTHDHGIKSGGGWVSATLFNSSPWRIRANIPLTMGVSELLDSPLLWPLMEIKYLCRLRSIEVVALTDAHASERGIYVARRKGSNDNIVWSPRLRAAWDAAISVRAQILARSSNAGRPFPARPEERFLFISESLTPMTVEGLNSIWRYLKRAAVKVGVIAPV